MCSSWDCLPDVNYCCWCIGLRCGSIIIALISIVFGGPGAVLYCVFACSSSMIVTILFYVLIVLCVILFITAIIFLIGMCADLPITAEIFIWVMFLTNLLAAIILVIAGILGLPGCLLFFLIGVAIVVVNFLIALYFMTVVNSFKNTDM